MLVEEIKNSIPQLRSRLKEAASALGEEKLRGKLADLEVECTVDGFWDNVEFAQKKLKEKKTIENVLSELSDIETKLSDIEVLAELSEEAGDGSMDEEVNEEYEKAVGAIEELTLRTLLTGDYDHGSAILSIHAGTGGVDAQDWAKILLRMYTRWAEGKGYDVKLLDLQDDVEAGIKSATLLIEGENAYGYLRCERESTDW